MLKTQEHEFSFSCCDNKNALLQEEGFSVFSNKKDNLINIFTTNVQILIKIALLHVELILDWVELEVHEK